MKIEVTNIIYELDGNIVDNLPEQIVFHIDRNYFHGPSLITEAIEEDWLVSGFDYRVDNGPWQTFREDMSWRNEVPDWFKIHSACTKTMFSCTIFN